MCERDNKCIVSIEFTIIYQTLNNLGTVIHARTVNCLVALENATCTLHEIK